MTEDIAEKRRLLIKEVTYRASYRGTLELDKVCRAMIPHLPDLSDAELTRIRDLLLNREGDLMAWLVEGEAIPNEWQAACTQVHGYFLADRVADGMTIRDGNH